MKKMQVNTQESRYFKETILVKASLLYTITTTSIREGGREFDHSSNTNEMIEYASLRSEGIGGTRDLSLVLIVPVVVVTFLAGVLGLGFVTPIFCKNQI